MAEVEFGTDGLRGLANDAITAEVALALGRATARVLPAQRFIVGRDTRRSGPLLSAALAAGLATEGADVIDVGVLPTPAVAHLCALNGAPGAVVSASHNPFFDNGIKVLASGGLKLTDEVEALIQAEMNSILADADHAPRRPIGLDVGTISTDETGALAYIEHLVTTLEPRGLAGIKVVVDCAHGAATPVAVTALSALGAEVIAIGDDPDGTNINDSVGSTHPEALCAAVIEHGAHLGLALDGDADRLVAVDHLGRVLDGDVLIALFARDLKERGTLSGDAVVVTVMSNLGFHRAMEAAGIAVRQVAVGDRNVLVALDSEGLSLGGEQSGHVIFRQRSTTGDGLLTGILLADLVRRSGLDLASLAEGAVTLYPQVLRAVPVADTSMLEANEAVTSRIAATRDELGAQGRVLVRASGTEPVVRVMVEAADAETAQRLADDLVDLIARTLG
ncbi:MAG: phosphoglucosamine mutase [Actinomycetes bacterium]